jgi:hypothetical protein
VVSGLGDPAAVGVAADDLRRASAIAERADALVRGLKPELWRGAAAEAFTSAATATLPRTRGLADSLLAASGTLTRYAAAQREALSSSDEAQSDFDRATQDLRGNPLDVLAAATLVQSRVAAFGAVGRLQQAASVAAGELRAHVGEEGDGQPWWDPFGWFTESEGPDERVDESILDDDAFDPDDVAQGSIGDCFMLSSIGSLLSSDAGDEFIRDNVRWDSEKEGFWVTLYSDGEPHEVFVDHVYGDGARQEDWDWLIFSGDKPSIAALYEAAISKEHGYGYLDGGVPADAMEMITGGTVDVVENSDYSGLDSAQVDDLRDVLDDGGQVVISSPRSGDSQITVTDADGETREIEVVNTHSYVVTRIDADGSVWMQNPWGPGNSADGGGEFRVSSDDVADLFWRATTTNVAG